MHAFWKWLLLLSAGLANTALGLSVYQVDAELYFAERLMTQASYVILEGDSSRYEQRGKGGYRLVLSVQENLDDSYTISSVIQSDNGKELETLGTPSIQVVPQQAGQVMFDHDSVGEVSLKVTLVRHEEVDGDELNECDYVECE
ncbi:hypothetical protein GCM10011297_00160 [Bacterioplanes sanyensis]|uniref:hypothetical protein n=1 Tax=Bacterioplanes sanyensis TaxID=1249553 RepID=UPI001677481D|nr:hypothetical protein [Bacterioplanes sanyensis]GGY31437.1 hypothetical protein GCM10011297_00160 [Bacterioplanes sanyensis]